MTIAHLNEVDPLACPPCGGAMKVIAFIQPPQGDGLRSPLHTPQAAQPGILNRENGQISRNEHANVLGPAGILVQYTEVARVNRTRFSHGTGVFPCSDSCAVAGYGWQLSPRPSLGCH